MPAPKGNQYAKGNRSKDKYKAQYADTAQKLCAKFGYIDDQLAEWFEVSVRTIHNWKLAHADFDAALRVGKSETDDLVEPGTVEGINGDYVTVDEMDRFGNMKQMRKWELETAPQSGLELGLRRRSRVWMAPQ